MKTPIYKDLLRILHENFSPYAGLTGKGGNKEPDGWSQSSPVFEELITQYRPEFIIEVGTWKGASAIHMADMAKSLELEFVILCVDTWLGSPIHWKTAEYRKELGIEHGYPTIYFEFLRNVIASGCAENILPLPLTSGLASRWLLELSLQADIIYIDADHEALSVYTDMIDYWNLVRPGGVMFGDDYIADWPGVVQAVQKFGAKISQTPLIFEEKWLFKKGTV